MGKPAGFFSAVSRGDNPGYCMCTRPINMPSNGHKGTERVIMGATSGIFWDCLLWCRVRTQIKASELVFMALARKTEGKFSGTRNTINQGGFTVLLH